MANKRVNIGLIINPKAKAVKRKYLPSKRFWEAMLTKDEYLIPESVSAIPSALRHYLEKDVEVLGILGGDGTMQVVLTELLKLSPSRYPMILPFRGGTINCLCNNIGQRDVPEVVLKRFLEQWETGRHIYLTFKHLIRVEEKASEHLELRFGFSFANGVMFRVYEEYYRYPNPGFSSALRLILRVFLSGLVMTKNVQGILSPVNMKLSMLGKEVISGKVRTVVASSFDNPVLWFKPFGAELDGRPAFHYLVNAMNTRELVWNMWDLFIGRSQHPLHKTGQTTELELETETGYLLDGELYPIEKPTKIVLKLGPALRFVTA